MLKKRKRTPLEFSKQIFLGVSVIFIGVIVFAMVMIWRTGDLSPLAYLIPAVATEMAAATGFYYNKAREENKIKLMQEHKIKITEQTFNQ